VYQGHPEDIVRELIGKYKLDALYINRSYSPKWKMRDENIMKICDDANVVFESFQDFLLVEPHECEQRKVFTPFSMLWKKFLLAHPDRLMIQEFQGDKTVTWFIPLVIDEMYEILSRYSSSYLLEYRILT
jgi:deoxyribodipyrimidine photolyase